MKYSEWPVVELRIADEVLRFEQDNGSMHVGTSVWPCSLLLAKWMEKQKTTLADLSNNAQHVKGKAKQRGVEVGAGCGVAGMALALLGVDVLLTDIPAVLPALKRNVKKNVQATSLAMAGKADCKAGKVKIGQLWWGNKTQIEATKPPFDYIIAADVVYLENTVEPLLSTIHALSGPHSVILLGYQIRCAEAHEVFWRLCPERFVVKKMSKNEVDDAECAFEEADVYILRKKCDN